MSTSLKGLKCLSALEANLANYDNLITKSLSEQFISLIFNKNEENDQLDKELLYLVNNIIQIKRIKEILSIYKLKCINEIAGITRTVYIIINRLFKLD